MLHKYNDFILESLLLESKVFYAKPFKKILNRINDDIAKDLLDLEKEDINQDITFINIDDREGYINFTTMKNAKRNLLDRFKDDVTNIEDYIDNDDFLGDDIWNLHSGDEYLRDDSPLLGKGGLRFNDPYEKSRSPLRLGRFINTVLAGKYSAKQVEDFVNKFKSAIEQGGERFMVVEGEDIAKWYNYTNYKEVSGTLGRSCMARVSSKYFDIYVKNPEVCRLVILLEDDKLIGRALLWNVDKDQKNTLGTNEGDFVYFMDRQYTIKDSDVVKFRNYANENNWAYKEINNHTNTTSVTFKGETSDWDLTIELSDNDYEYFPYMDTFKRYDPNKHILYNDREDNSENIGHYILESTGGDYDIINDNVWSEWYDCEIDRDDAVYSEPLSDWLYRSDATRVTIGTRQGYYPDSYEDLVYDEYRNENIHIDDSVFNSFNSEYFYKADAVRTVVYVTEEGDVDYHHYDRFEGPYEAFNKRDNYIVLKSQFENKEWYKKLSAEYKDWVDAEAILKETTNEYLVVQDYKNEWILDRFAIETRLIETENDTKLYYLLEEDAEALGFKLATPIEGIPTTRATDWFDYYKEIKGYESEPSLFTNITMNDLYQSIEDEERREFIDKWEI